MTRTTPFECLLGELCTVFGLCSGERDPERFQRLLSQGADAFAGAVLESEGLDPSWEKQLRREVRDHVQKYLDRQGSGSAA